MSNSFEGDRSGQEPGGKNAGTFQQYRDRTGTPPMSVNSLRAAIAKGEIKTIRFGRRILIPGSEFDKLAGL